MCITYMYNDSAHECAPWGGGGGGLKVWWMGMVWTEFMTIKFLLRNGYWRKSTYLTCTCTLCCDATLYQYMIVVYPPNNRCSSELWDKQFKCMSICECYSSHVYTFHQKLIINPALSKNNTIIGTVTSSNTHDIIIPRACSLYLC